VIRESLPVRLLLRASSALALPRLGDALSPPRLKVLMYHGVVADDRSQRPDRSAGVVNRYGYNVPVRRFEEQVAYVARRCRAVSLDDVLEGRLSASRVNVLLTFDDGYENNYTRALPVLDKHRVPALYALPTGFVDGRQPLWNDVLEHAVERSDRGEVTLEWDGEEASFDLASPGGRAGALVWLMRRAATCDPLRRSALLAGAGEALGVDGSGDAMFATPDYRPLDAEQIRELACGGLVELASHSVSHFMMARLPAELKRRELEESKRRIETLTGRPCRAFCVPGGSYDEELLDLAEELGYRAVLTSDWGWADPSARTLDRCGIFAGYDRHRFADEVHGPVVASLLTLRRALRGH
jgi:peptidoglycan/xylan/chitin deacetylase (PgdA/CDA1 family)